MLEALEEQVVVLKLLANMQDLGYVSVLIGEENEDDQLRSTAVVATGYGAQGEALGGLGGGGANPHGLLWHHVQSAGSGNVCQPSAWWGVI